MELSKLTLQNFRNHKKATFSFGFTTIIIGKNTAGKTNIMEAIHILSHGRSFRAEKDVDAIHTDELFSRVEGTVENDGKTALVVLFNKKGDSFSKKFTVNGIARRQLDFVSHFYSVIFTPADIEIITDSPSYRRRFIDSILYKALKPYRVASIQYEKALKQRNRMLSDIKDGRKSYGPLDFEYWDSLLIENGKILHDERQALLDYFNDSSKDIFEFHSIYDHSTITRDRLEKYYDAERSSGVTLVGPQRDEFIFTYPKSDRPIKEFGSRGEQRLTILQLKLLEVEFLKQKAEVAPTLLLDDIFSELDEENIGKIFKLLPNQQTILTTTHKEFIPKPLLKNNDLEIIEL